jgi:hypothetical protein
MTAILVGTLVGVLTFFVGRCWRLADEVWAAEKRAAELNETLVTKVWAAEKRAAELNETLVTVVSAAHRGHLHVEFVAGIYHVTVKIPGADRLN